MKDLCLSDIKQLSNSEKVTISRQLHRNIFKVFEICDAQAIELPSIRSTHFSIINST